ncbi:MAG: relaxase/mobilization nuclease domain-containing protein [Candidatus Ornithomonoglobus sp.]
MAYIKTFPIRYHVKSAIEYISNPIKTDGGRLVDTFHCTLPVADIEFKDTLRAAKSKGLKNVEHAARHLIQSFKPGEVTPEEAMRIGKEFAEKVLKGKYEYVIAAHVDTKAIHNHIIFNSVSFKDFHAEKSNKYTYRKWREISDNICREHGLSVIENPQKHPKQKQRDFYDNRETKRVIWRDILRSDIDKVIQDVNSFDEFLKHMEELGYSIKQGKYLSFKHHAQERYIRLRSLRKDYSEEDIRERIITKRPAIPRKLRNGNRDISLLISIETNIKRRTSPGYRHWANLHNLKEAAKTLNFLLEHNITSFDDLDNKVSGLNTKKQSAVSQLKRIESKTKSIAETIAVLENYEHTKPIAIEYDKAIFKGKFRQKHFDELRLFEASQLRLKELYPNTKMPASTQLRSKLEQLSKNRNKLYKEYKDTEKEIQTYSVMKKNIELFLNVEQKHKQPARSHQQSR